MFKFETINNKKILKSDLLEAAKATHFFTTRETVVIPKEMTQLEPLCNENLCDIAKYLKIEQENIICPVQTHSDNIHIAKKGMKFPDTDALIIEDSDIAILLNFADCTPVILFDEKNNVGAIAHAGWRGTASAIVKKTVQKMEEYYKSSTSDIIALIGPAISLKNYQVDNIVFEKLKSTLEKDYEDFFTYDEFHEKYNVDLKTVNQHQLEELGVLRIDKCDYCTYDSVDVFFSYRKEHGKTARHSAVMKLNQ